MDLSKLSNLIPGVAQVKTGLIIAAGIAVLSGLAWVKWEHSQLLRVRAENIVLVQNNKTLQQNNEVIKNNVNVCKNANVKNVETISKLIQERKDSQAAIDNLAKQAKSNKVRIGNLQQNLNALRKDPANDGQLAPVLRETLRGIQGASK